MGAVTDLQASRSAYKKTLLVLPKTRKYGNIFRIFHIILSVGCTIIGHIIIMTMTSEVK